MTIKTQITVWFTTLVVVIMTTFAFSIYSLSAQYRQDEFFERLNNQARFAADFYFKTRDVSAAQLQDLYEKQFTRLVDESLVIVNDEKKVMFSSGATDALVLSEQELGALKNNGTYNKVMPDNLEFAAITYPHDDQVFVVMVSAQDRYGASKLQYLRNILIGFLALTPVLLLLGGTFLASRALAPIRNIVDQVSRISSQNLNTRVFTKSERDEIAELASQFNQMLARLEDAFALNKSFVQNASHELRTPLTALRGQVEVALMQSRSVEEYRSLLNSLREDILNMTSLTNGLLELSQLSNEQYTPVVQAVRVDELLWDALDQVVSARPEYRIIISFADDAADSSLLVNGNEQWLRNCFQNLMENGCKFSPNHEVKVALAVEKQQVVINFEDEGMGIAAEEQAKIFEPFYRSERSMHVTGNGIGLSLCQRIIKLHQGTLTLKSALNEGSTFSVSLPLVQQA